MSSSNIQSEKHFHSLDHFSMVYGDFVPTNHANFFGESDDSGTSGDYSESGDFRDSDSIDTI